MYAAYASTDGTQAATSPVTTVTIAKAATKTTLTAPATSKVGATVTFTATVTAGTYVPTGSVTFQLPDGTVLAASNLDAKGVATVAVQMPAAATSYKLKATYNADANTTGSTSDTVTVLVTTSGSVVDLAVSAAPYLVGTPITLTATLTPSSATGSVTFRAGSTVIGAERVSSGKATITWRPTVAGAVALTASFIPTGETAPLGTDTEQITVLANLPPNAISVGPVGQAPWNAGQGYPLRFRSSVTLATKTASGAPLGLAITGPCTLAGLVITANAGAGTCTLTSTSPATSAYSAARQVNTIALAQAVQTATLTPPAVRHAAPQDRVPAGPAEHEDQRGQHRHVAGQLRQEALQGGQVRRRQRAAAHGEEGPLQRARLRPADRRAVPDAEEDLQVPGALARGLSVYHSGIQCAHG